MVMYHTMPDGRRVIIKKGEQLPSISRKRLGKRREAQSPSTAGNGMTELLPKLQVGDVAYIPGPAGFSGRLSVALSGSIRQYERSHGGKFVTRTVNGRVGVWRIR